MENVSERFAAALTKKFNERAQALPDHYGHGSREEYRLRVEHGQRYDRLVKEFRTAGEPDPDVGWAGTCAFAFVVQATGGLCKTHGWKGPYRVGGQPVERWNLSTEEGFAAAVAAADPYGGFLYARG
jgi:hypothetical protein